MSGIFRGGCGSAGLHQEGENSNEGPTLAECNKLVIVVAYILAIVIWTLILVTFRIGFDSAISIVVIVIPYLVFISAIMFIPTDTVFCDLRENTFFAIGLVAILPLITWYSQHYIGDKKRFITLAIMAVFVSMLALFEFCLPRSYICLLEHIRSILQTIGITLLIYVIAEFLVSIASGKVSQVPGAPSAAASAAAATVSAEIQHGIDSL